MAINNWLARAESRAKVMTLTPGGTIEVGDLFLVTINGKTVSYAATNTTVASVCTGLAAALEASTIIEFAAITWEDDTTHVTATGPTGVEVTVTVSTTESNGGAADAQTFALATTTAATGPNHWDDANNWSNAAVPVNADVANVDLSLGSILYGMAQSAVTLAELNIFSPTNTTNRIGLPRVNSGGYTEDQATYLAIGATLCRIDAEASSIALDFGSVQNTTEIRRSGQSTDGVTPAVLIKGTSTTNVLDAQTGNAGLAYYDGESYASASVKVAPGATLVGGAGADSDEIESLGTFTWSGTFDDFYGEGGQADIRGTPGADLISVAGGCVLQVKFGGTVAAVSVGGDSQGGTLDASNDRTARTFEATTIGIGGQIIDPNNTITYGQGIATGAGVRELRAA